MIRLVSVVLVAGALAGGIATDLTGNSLLAQDAAQKQGSKLPGITAVHKRPKKGDSVYHGKVKVASAAITEASGDTPKTAYIDLENTSQEELTFVVIFRWFNKEDILERKGTTKGYKCTLAPGESARFENPAPLYYLTYFGVQFMAAKK